MSQQKVAAFFNRQYTAAARRIPQFIGSSDSVNIVDTTWRTSDVVAQFTIGLTELLTPLEKDGLLEPGFVKGFTTNAKIESAVKEVIKNIKAGGGNYPKQLQLKPWSTTTAKGKTTYGRSGNYFLRRSAGGAGLTFRFISVGKGTGTGANDAFMQRAAAGIRIAIYKEWLKDAEGFFSRLPKISTDRGNKARNVITKNTQRAHEMNTTKGALALGYLKDVSPAFKLNAFITNTDLIEQIENNIQLDYARNFKDSKVGGLKFRYMMSTSIRANRAGSEQSDIKSIKTVEVEKAVSQLFIKEMGIEGAALAYMDGSIPPVKSMADKAILDIVVPLTKGGKPDRRFKINKKMSAKKFKGMKDSFKGKRAKNTAVKTSTAQYVVAAKIAGGKRPQKEKRDATADLLKVETLINKRLPAQVRRNMGRPALINQTGRFSNSVEIGKLHQTKAGLSGEYTYQKSPYETFENTGNIRWPSGYNPKPLIAKSIRELAMQYTEQKLVSLRRR